MFKQNMSDMTVNRTWKFKGYLGEFNIKKQMIRKVAAVK